MRVGDGQIFMLPVFWAGAHLLLDVHVPFKHSSVQAFKHLLLLGQTAAVLCCLLRFYKNNVFIKIFADIVTTSFWVKQWKISSSNMVF